MNTRIVLLFTAAVLAGCASNLVETPSTKSSDKERAGKKHEGEGSVSRAGTLDAYKRDMALHISEVNAGKVYPGRPQALLRSVVVVRYTVDARGHLVRSEIMRSNRDPETESTALAALRSASPFPKPAPHLLRRGELELAETWLFNNDGRFQLRTIAQAQIDQ